MIILILWLSDHFPEIHTEVLTLSIDSAVSILFIHLQAWKNVYFPASWAKFHPPAWQISLMYFFILSKNHKISREGASLPVFFVFCFLFWFFQQCSFVCLSFLLYLCLSFLPPFYFGSFSQTGGLFQTAV